MEPRLAALKLFLEELDVPATIDTIDDRKRVQKAVYLGQALSGADLGYRFGWYLMGPYSPALTRDYYALADEAETGDNGITGLRLAEALRGRLARVRGLFQPPEGVDLPQEGWLELIASYHFLQRVARLGEGDAERKIGEEKETLASHIPEAKEALRSLGAVRV